MLVKLYCLANLWGFWRVFYVFMGGMMSSALHINSVAWGTLVLPWGALCQSLTCTAVSVIAVCVCKLLHYV